MVELEIGLATASIAAGVAVGVAGLGSGIGQGLATEEAAPYTATNPKFFGKGLLFAVTPQTQVIYGLVIAILILISSGVV